MEKDHSASPNENFKKFPYTPPNLIIINPDEDIDGGTYNMGEASTTGVLHAS